MSLSRIVAALLVGAAILVGGLGPLMTGDYRWLYGSIIALLAIGVAALIIVSAPKPTDPTACTCGWHALSNGGPNDPECPQHGHRRDPPAGSVGVTMERTTDRRPE